MKQLKRYLHLLLLIFCTSIIRTQAQKLEVKQYNQAQLLGKSNIYDFCQDQNLIFYFGTDKGILIFDGQDFYPMLKIGENSLSKAVRNITYLNHHLFFTHNNSLYNYSQKDSILTEVEKNININKLITKDNQLYYSTNNRLFTIKDINKGISEVIFSNDKAIINDWSISEENIVIGSSEGLFTINKLNNNQVAIGSYLNALKLIQNTDSTFLILGQLKAGKSGVYKYDYNRIIKETDLDVNTPKDFYYSNIGDIWIGSLNGDISIYDGFSIKKLKSDNNYKKFNIEKFIQDKEGNLWVLGNRSTLMINVNGAITQEQFNNIKAIESHGNELVFVGEKKIKISSAISEDIVINIPSKYALSETPAPFYHDNKWYFNGEKSLIVLSEKTLSEIKRTNNLSHIIKIGDQIYGIALNKVFLLDDNFEIIEHTIDINKNDKVRFYNNKILVLNDKKELSIIKNDSKLFFNLTSLADVNLNYVKEFDNTLWTFDNSNIIFKNSKEEIQKININDILNRSHLRIYNIFIDSNQNLWASINNEIVRFTIIEKANQISLQFLDYYDENDNFYTSYFEEAVELEDGTICFIHPNNITLFNPLLENSSLVKPGIKLRDVFAYTYDRFKNLEDTIKIDVNKTFNLAYNSSIHIKATAITTIKKSRSNIKYKVVELDQDWFTINSDDLISIYGLPIGQNTIIVKSINSDGIESDEEISISIIIAPPFWQEYWFYLVISFSIAVIGFVIYGSLNNYKDNKTKELHEKLDKELGDLEKRSHLQILKAERLKQLNDLITSQKSELEKKNKQIESQKYELSLTNQQIKKQKDLLEDTSSKLKASINYAQRIQNALMSTEIEIKEAIDESFVYFQPRDVVSGDFYWFNKVVDESGDELLILAAVDCTGHGVPGAIVSVVGMNLLNNITNLKKINDPGKILFELNKDIILNLRQNETQVNDGMDMTIVSINQKTREIKFAGAKNPLMYVENGELIRIRGDKFAIGGQQREKDRNYITHTISPLAEPRMYFLFSDGYQDQFGGEKGFKFLTSNFKALLLEIHDKHVLDQKEILYDRINDWKGDYHQTDDMLVIGFRL